MKEERNQAADVTLFGQASPSEDESEGESLTKGFLLSKKEGGETSHGVGTQSRNGHRQILAKE